MPDDAVQLFRMLVEAGAKPGEDFSYDLQGAAAQISERALVLLQYTYPEVDWSSLCEVKEYDPADAAAALNASLGRDFVGQILTCLANRIEELPEPQAVWYLQQVLGGVEHRTQVPLYVLLRRRLSLESQMKLERLLRQEGEPCYLWMQDLIEAAGGRPEDVELHGDEATLTQAGLTLLSAVWAGEYDVLEEPE